MSFGKLGAMGRGMGHLGSLGGLRKPWIGLPGTVYYVSKAASNGFAVGSDSNTTTQAKSMATPWATISKFISSAAAGDICVINDGSFSGTELGASNFIAMTGSKLFNLFAYNSGQVTCSASSAVSGLVRINSVPASGSSIINGIIFDDAATGSHVVLCDNASGNMPTLTFTNCTFKNPTLFGINITATQVALTLNNVTIISPNRACLSALALASPSTITINGGSFTITDQTTSGDSGLNLKATASGVTATISGAAVSVTINNSQVGTATHDVIKALNVGTTQITGCTATLLNHPSTRVGACIRVANDAAVAVAATISGNTCDNQSTGGYGILVGTDATGAANNNITATVERNIVTAVRANQSTPVHGIMVAWQQGGIIRRNKVSNCGHGIVSKANTTNTAYVYSNIVVDSEFELLYAKGSANVIFSNNTAYVSQATTANTVGMVRLGVGDDSVTGCSSVTIENNILYAASAAALKVFDFVDNPSAGTFNNNDYYLASGSLPTGVFSYQSTTYDTVAAWAAAHEATAISGDPAFVAPGTDFNLGAGSAAKWAGVAVANVDVDYNGTAWHSPPSVGALEAA
jgi:hypothetical protein